MKFKIQAGIKVSIAVLVFLVPLGLRAQDCTTTIYLDSRTIKSGEEVTIEAGTILNPPGKQFVIDNGGKATFHAAGRIQLEYGFKALPGGVLNASVTPCVPGEPPKDPAVVFPNPTDGVFTVKAAYTINALRLTDMGGVSQFEMANVNDTSVSVDISKLKPGYYILEIIAGRTVMESIRIEKK